MNRCCWLASCFIATSVVALLGAAAAQAQVFSPGALSKGHSALEGVSSCGKCHGDGGKNDDTRCVACHEEIGTRETNGTGYHARVQARDCAECHREHRGVDRSLIVWTPSQSAFNHAQTGWPLVGAHKKNACAKCHEPRRIDAADAKALQEKGRDTFLGVGASCKNCHFDEHRGQEGERCEKCHTAADPWKKAPGFNHGKDARFALTGKHRGVDCAKCHSEASDDAAASAATFPAPRAQSYLQMKGIAFVSCASCHDDPHRGQFGKKCSQCHVTDGWRVIKQTAEDQGFHDKTAFPLRGEHTSVACKTCHGPFPGQRAVFKGLAHARCNDCHLDAHVGQLAREESRPATTGGSAPDCASCHDVTGFARVKFDASRHAQTRFPLDGAHAAVSCALCHVDDAKLERKMPAHAKRDAERKGRRALVSRTKLAFAGDVTRCETCHRDPHAGQFNERMSAAAGGKGTGCAACHGVDGFAPSTFNHDDSRFPLTGRHKETKCAACHAPDEARGKARVVVYRPMETACAACHADEHAGQLATAGATDCARCHRTDAAKGFAEAPAFKHDAPFTSFALVGKHAQVRCASCHPAATLAGGDTATRYKPMPSTCAECHEDEHRGRYDKFKPPAPDATPAPAAGAPAGACVACHSPAGFLPAAFAHERTGFALQGRHRGTACTSCHGADTSRPVPQSCAACHTDPHVQEFGLACNGCHDESSFRAPRFAVDAHRRSNFPLIGRHGAIPCEECHADKRDRVFTRTALDCASCHARDATRASLVSVSHARAPFNASCNACHDPVAFTPAKFPGHEACFPIARTVHSGVRCAECHSSSSLRGAVTNGSCAGVAVRCAECHVHAADVEARNHQGVAGYEHESEKCAGCHRGL